MRDGTEFIFDIGHNPPALAINFARLEEIGKNQALEIVYGIMADKDLDAIAPLLPSGATYRLVAPDTPRALPAAELLRRIKDLRPDLDCRIIGDGSVAQALESPSAPIVYVGGSTFVVSEALKLFE